MKGVFRKNTLFLINYNDLHQAGSAVFHVWLLVDLDGGWVSAQNGPFFCCCCCLDIH